MTDSTSERAARLLALCSVSGLGDGRIAKLLDKFGSAAAVLQAPFDAFDKFHFIDRETYAELTSIEKTIQEYEAQLTAVQQGGVEILCLGDERYPESIAAQNAPVVLFAKGDTDLLTAESVSFAGSRDANDHALEWTRAASATLADAGYTIVSGGALGVDTAAHKGAVDVDGKTVVVLPGGITNRYPAANEELFERISATGLLLSQQLPNHSPSRYDFLNRNKTNSALSHALVIGAAGASGGTMSQYQDAMKQDTEVFVPSTDLGIEPAEGIEQILADDGATTVESGDEIKAKLEETKGQTSLGDW